MNRIIIAGLALAIIAPATLHAQIINACYVKNTGTMYRVGAASSPTQCSSNHIPFSWNQVGPQGPAGPQGAQGIQGPAGPAGVLGYRRVQTTGAYILAGQVSSRTVYCAAGEVLLGGGFHPAVQHDQMQVVFSGPSYKPDYNLHGWEVRIRNTAPSASVQLTVHVMCAKAPTS